MEQKRKEINGVVYLVTQLDGRKALKVQTTLIKIIGPALKTLDTNITKSLQDQSKILDLLQPIIENFDDDMVYNFVLSLFEKNVYTEKVSDGQKIPVKIDFDTHFAGKIMDVWPVVMFIIETNFNLGE